MRGEVAIPGDKSIGHRALIFGALADGTSTVRGLSAGEDNAATANAFRSLGVDVRWTDDGVCIEGVGLDRLSAPNEPIHCGNSGTTMRLLGGLLSAQRFSSRLVGDESLSCRPMGRIVDPLRARGAHISGTEDEDGRVTPPIVIEARTEPLAGIEYAMPVASAQVKSALLLSGLYAGAPTAISEPMLSRDHTERMMMALGVPLETMGPMVVLNPAGWRRGWDAFDWEIPGDLSGAAFLLGAAQLLPGTNMTLPRVGVNPTRTGLLDALRMMGAPVDVVAKGEGAGAEPIGDLHVQHRPASGVLIGGELVVRMIDEVPALCVIAAGARGETVIRDAAELRVKESDRIDMMVRVLTAFGVPCNELSDGMRIEGGSPIKAAHVHSGGDHRVAMAAAVLGLAANGETLVDGIDCVDTSFPWICRLPSRGGRRHCRGGDMSRSRPVVAIDGPAGAGKSSAARQLANRLGFGLVDTGSMYRAVALIGRERGVSWDDADALGPLSASIDLRFETGSDGVPVLLVDGRDRSQDIRSPEISGGASDVSRHPLVRDALLGLQRQLGSQGGVVLEGRDIGTVVFPDAEVKVFLTADENERARRRWLDLQRRGDQTTFEKVLKGIQERDAQDSQRDVAPLAAAEDAVRMDTTDLDLAAVVSRLADLVRRAQSML